MSRLIDLTGQTFGRLTVLRKDDNRKTNCGSYWICKCSCGKEKSIRSSSLRRGEIQSCGCYRMEQVMKTKEEKGLIDNLVGNIYGYLTVIEKDPQRANDGSVKWICKCQCGKIVSVRGNNLKRKDENRTISCGCAKMSLGELNIYNLLKENNIEFSQEQTFSSLGGKRFDFAIWENNHIVRLVEFDGEGHYQEVSFFDSSLKERQKRDQEKNDWAIKNKIPLVRIPYWERDNITLDLIFGDKYRIN